MDTLIALLAGLAIIDGLGGGDSGRPAAAVATGALAEGFAATLALAILAAVPPGWRQATPFAVLVPVALALLAGTACLALGRVPAIAAPLSRAAAPVTSAVVALAAWYLVAPAGLAATLNTGLVATVVLAACALALQPLRQRTADGPSTAGGPVLPLLTAALLALLAGALGSIG